MTHYADLAQQGYHLLRHHDQTFDVKYRLVSFACRIGGPDRGEGQGYDDYGILQGVRPNWSDAESEGKDTHGDIVNWSMWQIDDTQGTIHDGASAKNAAPPGSKQRTIPGWAQAWAALAIEGTTAPDDSGGQATSAPSGTITVQPVFSQKWDADGRFKGKSLPLPPGFDNVPQGVPVVVLCGTDEYSQQDLAIPVMPNSLTAPHEHGNPNLGTYVYDLTQDDELDKERRAHLQTLTRVWQLPKSGVVKAIFGEYPKHALAIQMGQARGGVNSRAVFADFGFPKQVLGAGSIVAHGPLHVGSNSDKHSFGTNDDGDTLNSLHIWTDAYFKRDDFFDGPIEFNGMWVPPGSAGQPWKTFINFDPNDTHSHPTGDKLGKWKLETWVPVIYPTDPAKDSTFTAPSDADQTFTNPDQDGTFQTNPIQDKTFTDPSADGTFTTPGDDTFGTNTPVNPDADQTFPPSGGGNPPTDGPVGPSDGPLPPDFGPGTGKSTIVIKPKRGPGGSFSPPTDGPSGGTGRSTPVIKPKGGFTGSGVIPGGGFGGGTFSPPTDGPTIIGGGEESGLIPVDGQTLQPLEPPQIDIQPDLSSGQPELFQGVSPLTTANMFAAPGFVFKAQNILDNDMRYSRDWGSQNDIHDIWYQPAVAQVEATGGLASDGTWNYSSAQGADRFGYSAQGAVNFMPPNVGTEQIFYSQVPSSFPTTSFNFYQSRLTFGTPLTDGLVGDGFAIYLSGGNLVVDTLGADGATTGSANLWPDVDPGAGPGGLTTGPLVSLPGTPTAVGDTYIITDKVNTPGGGSGSADPTDFFNVGINDALMWAKLAVLNFDQKITGIWTSNGTITYGSGTVDANHIRGKDTPTTPGSGQALIYNGTAYATSTLGIAGGGTNNTSYGSNAVPYYDGSKLNGATPTAGATQGGQVLTFDGSSVGWQFGLNHGAKSGADQTGVVMDYAGQQSTGSGIGGGHRFRVSPAGGSGSGVNSLATAFLIDGSLNVTMSGSLATSATNGFFYINSCAGTPTGVPTPYSNQVALVVDRTNSKLYGYIGAWTALGGGAGGSDLPTTLAAGNTTGGHNIVITSGDKVIADAAGHNVAVTGVDGTNSFSSLLTVQSAAAADNAGGGINLDCGNYSDPVNFNLNTGASLHLGGATTTRGGIVSLLGGSTDGPADTVGNTFVIGACAGAGLGHDGGIAMQVAPISLTGGGLGANSLVTVWTLQGVQNDTSGTSNLLTINPTWRDGGQASSTVGRTVYLSPTFNYTGATTGNYEILVVNATETAAPGGTNYHARFQVGGTDRASIYSDGSVMARRKVVSSTSTVTVATTDSRKLFTNTSASAQVTHNLPAATIDLEYVYYVDATTGGIKVVANGTDTIRVQGAVSAAGGNAASNTQGSALVLVCVASGKWVATSALGTWTVT